MIVITGAAGFIGSCLVAELNQTGYKNLILVDDFTVESKRPNLAGKSFAHKIQRNDLWEWLDQNGDQVHTLFHIGARTDTAEQNWDVLTELNVQYSRKIWAYACRYDIALCYASSAATYGDGSLGFSDDPDLIPKLNPLNPYGRSKQLVDQWILTQEYTPRKWVGFKFFNVYGPNEYHKGRMASVIYHAFPQIRDEGHLRLFRSHREEFEDGMQLRDFLYVRDLTAVLLEWMEHPRTNGIYNLGTGKARTFLDLGVSVFQALEKETRISFFDIPQDIRAAYQYFTEADMHRFRKAGYVHRFKSLEQGSAEYVREFLLPGSRL